MENNNIYEIMNGKQIYSRFSNTLVTFVPEITDEMKKTKDGVFSNGISLVDNLRDAEGDISNMFCIMKDESRYNMQDFYSDFGAYEDGDLFPKNCKQLILDRE